MALTFFSITALHKKMKRDINNMPYQTFYLYFSQVINNNPNFFQKAPELGRRRELYKTNLKYNEIFSLYKQEKKLLKSKKQ